MTTDPKTPGRSSSDWPATSAPRPPDTPEDPPIQRRGLLAAMVAVAAAGLGWVGERLAGAGHNTNIAYSSQTVMHMDVTNTGAGSTRINSNISGTAAFVALNNYPVGISRPDGKSVSFVRDSFKRLEKLTLPRGSYSFTYDAASGTPKTLGSPDGVTNTLSFDGLLQTGETWGGPLTGAAMNSARWFGPAVASGTYDDWYVWWIGPLLGAAIAALIYRYSLEDRGQPEVTPATPET